MSEVIAQELAAETLLQTDVSNEVGGTKRENQGSQQCESAFSVKEISPYHGFHERPGKMRRRETSGEQGTLRGQSRFATREALRHSCSRLFQNV